jgi:hypothetical protein
MRSSSAPSRQQNLAMMATPASWPHYPFLPLQRVCDGKAAGGDGDLGVLYDAWGSSRTPGYSATVFLANYLLLPPNEELLFALSREVFDTLEEMFDAGWRVD